MIDHKEAKQHMGPVELDKFYQAMNDFMQTGDHKSAPGYIFFLGWVANNAARVPRDTGDLADSRILDFVDELMGILHTGHPLNHHLQRRLEEKLTPLLSLAFAEMDRSRSKDPSWELIPRRHHRLYRSYPFMRGRI